MKHYLIFFLITLQLSAAGQVGSASNDWINYSQQYFQIPISKTGIYKITYSDLVNANVSVPTINPKNLQIFGRGEEQYIYVSGENDGKFDSGDYIEFYAEKNDGWYDANLFSKPEHQGNPDYSMFNDTIYYYLTLNSSTNNKRIGIDIDVNFTGYTPLEYCFREDIKAYSSYSNTGELTFFKRSVPEYSSGEGWGAGTFKYERNYGINFTIGNVFTAGPNAEVKIGVAGRTTGAHYVSLNHESNKLETKQFWNYEMGHFSNTVTAASLANSAVFRTVSENNSNNVLEEIALMYARIKYPSTFDFGGDDAVTFWLPPSGNSKDFLQLSNFVNNNSAVWLYDLTNHRKIVVQSSGVSYSALVKNTSLERKMYLVSDAKTRRVTGMRGVGDGNAYFTNYQGLADAKGGVDFLIVTTENFLNEANEYADYRETKGLKSLVLLVEQLYHQYSVGIVKHPLSVRNMLTEAMTDWSKSPQYLLLLGKSISADASRSGEEYPKNLVPTWGVPGSDVGFSAGINGLSVLAPTIATGRVAAVSPEQVKNYLNKLMEYEGAEPADWMKQVIHFGGGSNSSEQITFKNYLSQFEQIIADTLFGAKVHTFLKTTSDPLQKNLGDSVTNLITNGVSIMTFFGHAYGQNFDQSIEEPSAYNNKGRYNVIIANSCLIGNIHTKSVSGSENFVLAQDRGSIAFIGSSTLGVPYYLYQYTDSLYANLTYRHYGESIGNIVKYTVQAIEDSTNQLNRDVSQHMTLHGDPAFVLNSWPLPDYTLYKNETAKESEVYFSPSNITTALDSFDINIVIRNIGSVRPTDTINLVINRSSVLSKDTAYYKSILAIYYKDTVTVRVPVNANYAGVNVFNIQIDPEDDLLELTNLNNEISLNVVIESDLVYPIYPYEYAIVPERDQTLKAYTSSPFASYKTYVFEIDTTGEFNSPSLTAIEISSVGGVLECSPFKNVGLQNFYNKFSSSAVIEAPTVFFWRVKEKNAPSENWQSSSFQHVTSKTGWGQAHFHQFEKSNFTFIDYKKQIRKLDFIDHTKTIRIENVASPTFRNLYPNLFYENSLLTHYNGLKVNPCQSLFFITVFDPITLEPWHAAEHGDLGHLNKLPEDIEPKWNAYKFQFRSGDYSAVANFLDLLPDSAHIALYTYRCGTAGGHNLPTAFKSGDPSALALKNKFSEWGMDVDSMENYQDTWPYNFFAKKGRPALTHETYSTDGEVANDSYAMNNHWINGTMASTEIGPAARYEEAYWESGESEVGNIKDTSKVTLNAINTTNGKVTLLDTLGQLGVAFDISAVDVKVNPTMQFEAFLADDSLRTPRQFKRWQVIYQPVADLALTSARLPSTYELKDSIQQGEEFIYQVAIENVSPFNFDSVQIVYWILDANYNVVDKAYKMLAPLAGGQYYLDSVQFTSINLAGNYSIYYEINPFDGPAPHQNEQYHFNNFHLHRFVVEQDKINPILDVTFDGIHILDGDIVSPKPHIVITLDDENQYLLLNDPSDVELYLKYPINNAQDSLRLLSSSEYTFTAGELPKNKATIVLNPEFRQDGVYTLGIRSTDRSNNASGKADTTVYDYKINFQVILESSITQVMNWPNPFSTSTQFVFTLTGSEIPQYFQIQIMTITGKIVREIDKDEFGPINIGRNISEFKWDGKDQYGDQLANGVYLYRVNIQDSAIEFKERGISYSDQSEATTIKDKFFVKGFGKMYLMR